MEALYGFLHTVIAFLVVLTVVVFFHELGHYWIARLCGVRVETFSVGFGREIFGRTSKSGTRWKLCMIPFGGYVKFFGDAGATSNPDKEAISEMSAADRAVSFHHKSLGQRAAIVAAGPIANFILAIVILAAVFMAVGRPFTPAVIGEVMEESAAAEAGLEPGDRIVAIDGSEIERFESLREIVMFNPGVPLRLTVERDGQALTLEAVPRPSEITDDLGNTHSIGLLGVAVGNREFVRLGPFGALGAAVIDTYSLVSRSLQGLGQIITGARDADELGGPILIAQMSGERAEEGLVPLLEFMVILSATLGLINLFPIPVLDGGHLAFYAIEAVRGRPMGARAQEVGYMIGLAMVVMLMVFATFNDLRRPAVLDFFTNLIG